jgi:glycosyltransferase involved in cell wall biosynthesis
MKNNLFIMVVVLLLNTNIVICVSRSSDPAMLRVRRNQLFRQSYQYNIPKDPDNTLQKPIAWHTSSTFTGEHADTRDTVLKTSIIIPCCATHAQHLYSLLKLYEEQTELPDEVIISLSSCCQVPDSLINELEHELWRFPVTLLLSKQTLFAGANRNVACCHATGDIFICQDADDIPHPQRIEIIKYFFTTYNIDHLIHQWVRVVNNDVPISFVNYENTNTIQFVVNEKFNNLFKPGTFHNGNIAIARYVFDEIQWSPWIARGEDVALNVEIYKQFNHCFAIEAILLGYREFLSSENKNTPIVSRLAISKKDPLCCADKNLYPLNIVKLQ